MTIKQVEMAIFFAVALAIDTLAFGGDRFRDVAPHPFWAVVVLVSLQYGTNEGLIAAVASSAALLIGNIPPQPLSLDSNKFTAQFHFIAFFVFILLYREELLRVIFGKLSDCSAWLTLLLDTLSKMLLNSSASEASDGVTLRYFPPALMQSIIQFLLDGQRLHEVRQWIANVDITCVDLDLVTKLCWSHGIYDAIVHIYTCAMLDYKSPLENECFKKQTSIINIPPAQPMRNHRSHFPVSEFNRKQLIYIHL